MLRATFEMCPDGSSGLLAPLGGHVVADDGDTVVVDLPSENWGADVNLLVAAVVAGEVMEAGALTRCRLVDLEVPDGLLPGPAFGASGGATVEVMFAHRAGSGPWARNAAFGPTGAVLARLLRLCGADYVVVGAFFPGGLEAAVRTAVDSL